MSWFDKWLYDYAWFLSLFDEDGEKQTVEIEVELGPTEYIESIEVVRKDDRSN